MQILSTVELTKSYKGRKVVDDISLKITQGEVVGLLGPNGAGKTTTFYIMVGLVTPDSGEVLLDGIEITHLPMYLRARNGISYLPQEPSESSPSKRTSLRCLKHCRSLPTTAARDWKS